MLTSLGSRIRRPRLSPKSFLCILLLGAKGELIFDDKPEWIASGTHPNYSSPRYVVGVGLAQSAGDPVSERSGADQNAFAEVVRQLSSHVSTEILIERMEVVGDKLETIVSKTSSGTKNSSSLTVSGLKVVERYYDKSSGMNYSLAILDRKEASAIPKASLLAHQRNYTVHLNSANVSYSSGKLTQALTALKSAFYAAHSFEDVLPTYNLLVGSNGTELGSDFPSTSSTLAKLSEMLAGLKLQIRSGGDQRYIPGMRLAKELSVQLHFQDDPEKGLENADISFSFRSGTGNLTLHSLTDAKGIASSHVEVVDPSSPNPIVVSAGFSLEALADTGTLSNEWNKRLIGGSQEVTFQLARKVPTKMTRVFVSVVSRTPSEIALESIFSETINRYGMVPLTGGDVDGTETLYSIVSKGSSTKRYASLFEYLIVGEISVKPLSEVEGMKVCSAAGSVRGISTKTGVNISVESLNAVRGFGNTHEQARENALRAAATQAAEKMARDILASVKD